ncbi:tRNA pseudouridine(55) synthase TruB [Cohnella hongkongensis]|uniref:tRNA pseudouridine synthase B n=1 Tax=Cohnella hongkongensis TaxID=178337 RepID=A0ABV9FD81_9BACL
MKDGSSTWEGVLAIWKPAGWTSHDVVARARRLLRERRIGHTGTLDPSVTGVLPLCVGRATRLVEYLQEAPKTYRAKLKFGIATDTEDLDGEVIERKDATHLTEPMIRESALSFVGEIDQIPPMVSAVKVNGKRLYELARQGVTVERQARRITIHRLEVEEVTAGVDEPELAFTVTCSKGTYIRTLCADIGRKLGVPAVMAELVRTESAGIGQESCVTLEEIPELLEQGELGRRLLAADKLLTQFPAAVASEPESRHLLQGKTVQAAKLQPPPDRRGLWKLYRSDGVFLGLFSVDEAAERVRPVKVFHPSEDRPNDSQSD